MYDSSTPQATLLPVAPVPTVGLRIAVLERRTRFAALLSHLSGHSIERAWRAFRPLPAPDGAWGVPGLIDSEERGSSHPAARK
jgi:hypothetical protein